MGKIVSVCQDCIKKPQEEELVLDQNFQFKTEEIKDESAMKTSKWFKVSDAQTTTNFRSVVLQKIPERNQNKKKTNVIHQSMFNMILQQREFQEVNNHDDSQLKEMQGTLMRKRFNRLDNLRAYEQVWCTSKDHKFQCYRMKYKNKHPSYTFDFNLLNADVKYELKNKEYNMRIYMYGREKPIEFKFKKDKENNLNEWYRVIKKHIQTSKGQRKDEIQNLKAVISDPNFFHYDRISEKQFLETADTGDILLFRTQNFNANAQRLFSGAHYDHVGLILGKGSSIAIFEAEGGTGVGTCSWNKFKRCNWQKLYQAMVFRKLNFEKDDQTLHKLFQFVNQNRGKKYGIGGGKLMKQVSKFGTSTKGVENYFCSQLVAYAYKVMGLLEDKKSSCQYWPGNFDAKHDMKLLKGATFGPEQIIDFKL